MGYEWDEVLPKQFQGGIQDWVVGLKEIKATGRCLVACRQETGKKSILIVDASEKAYCTCIYLKSTNEQSTQITLVATKVRAAPLRRLRCLDLNFYLPFLELDYSITRVLHLELVDSLSVDDFILTFRRFVARRALPSIIYSDNAKTFKAANSLLQSHFGKEIVCWKNICPLSPNWGGWWERLVGSVKSSLRKSLGRQTVNKVDIETILREIEACVNSRPLMHIAEKGKILAPSHFLIGRATPLTSTELNNFEQVINLSEREELEESLTERFWQIWKTEYLRNLPPLTLKSKKTNNSLQLGSVVLIRDEKKPRM
ncbi:hypothetical protein PoB_005224900 [Plakobranchus ocellatus]|uniref:Integrase catalytic domain-containing protein n=1 Tax=Plakobranchus ocellatus TaxID=259542 RepID=A0AAV4BZQ8_9GAST|nr:hypothetical protein PoB_005224900 [Plakobranchus ocellatus]